MKLLLEILLALFCIQGLVKFVAGFAIPYPVRIGQIAKYYEKDERIIKIYDDIILLVVIVMLALLLRVGADYLSFITGLLTGMLLIQVFFHRFVKILPNDRAPKQPVPPIKQLSYAIQDAPGLAWKEIVIMAAIFLWSLYMIGTHIAL